MEMHPVRYFLALAEELNFTRARASGAMCTQPSLSGAIELLKEKLDGLLLFHRERGSMRLTALGHMARPHLQSVYDQPSLVKRLSRELAKKAPLTRERRRLFPGGNGYIIQPIVGTYRYMTSR